MNILFLIRSLDMGGAERQLILLASELKKRGHNIVVAVFYSGGILEAELSKHLIPIVFLKKKGRFDCLFFLRLQKAIKTFKPDILYSYLPTANIIAVLLRCCGPSLKVIWGVRSSNINVYRYGWLVKFSQWLEIKLSAFPNHIIFNSHAGYQHALTMGFKNKSLSVIHNGFDVNRFNVSLEKRNSMRLKWSIPSEALLIGLVARIDPLKNHHCFLEACTLLQENIQNCYFVCVGKGSEQATLTLKKLSMVQKLGAQLLWIDEELDMEGVYNAMDILCSTSISEGFSNVIAEAMACGIPCVVTDVGDSAYIVGEEGLVVPLPEARQLANACQLLIDRGLKSETIRKRIVSQFSVASMVQKTESLMEGIL